MHIMNPTPRIALFVRPFVTNFAASYIYSHFTMAMYDALIIIIICVRYSYQDDEWPSFPFSCALWLVPFMCQNLNGWRLKKIYEYFRRVSWLSLNRGHNHSCWQQLLHWFMYPSTNMNIIIPRLIECELLAPSIGHEHSIQPLEYEIPPPTDTTRTS